MKVSVGYNWDFTSIKKFAEIGVAEIFAAPHKNLLGSGRSSSINDIFEMTDENIFDHISETKKCGLRFNYLLNSTYIDKSLSKSDIITYLKKIESINPDLITCANKTLIDIATESINIPLKISINAHLANLKDIEQFITEKVVRINLDTTVNRNLPMLKMIRKNFDIELELLSNQGCLRYCSRRNEHNRICSILSSSITTESQQIEYQQKEIDLIKCCHKERLNDPTKLISAPWIRPEDLIYYEDLGYDYIKVAGRMKSSEWMLNAASAYVKRKYNGNLLDIISLCREELLFGQEKSNGFIIDNNKLDDYNFGKNIFSKQEVNEYYNSISQECATIENKERLTTILSRL